MTTHLIRLLRTYLYQPSVHISTSISYLSGYVQLSAASRPTEAKRYRYGQQIDIDVIDHSSNSAVADLSTPTFSPYLYTYLISLGPCSTVAACAADRACTTDMNTGVTDMDVNRDVEQFNGARSNATGRFHTHSRRAPTVPTVLRGRGAVRERLGLPPIRTTKAFGARAALRVGCRLPHTAPHGLQRARRAPPDHARTTGWSQALKCGVRDRRICAAVATGTGCGCQPSP